MSFIFNKVFGTGIYPNHFKETEIIPVYKTGEKNSTTNYWPKILSKYQFGFTPNIGTSEALAHVSDLLHSKLDESLPTKKALAKAFDVVNYDILLHKLELLGIRSVTLKLFKNYLYNRKHFVRINNTRSSIFHPRTGVTHGTVIGPLLFLLYINDIFNILPENQLIAYADDTILLCSASTLTSVKNNCNELLLSTEVTITITSYFFHLVTVTLTSYSKISNLPNTG